MSPFSFVRSKFGGPRKDEEQSGADDGSGSVGSDEKGAARDDLSTALSDDDWLTRGRRPEEDSDDDLETMSWSDMSDSDDADVERFRKSLTIGDSLEDVDWDAIELGDRKSQGGVQPRRRRGGQHPSDRDPNAPAFTSDQGEPLNDLGEDPSEAIRALADRALAGRVRDGDEAVRRGAPPRGGRSRRRMRGAKTELDLDLDAVPEPSTALDAPVTRMEPVPELSLDADPDALDALWASESAALLAQSTGEAAPVQTPRQGADNFGFDDESLVWPEEAPQPSPDEPVTPGDRADNGPGEVSEEDVRAAIAAWTSGVNERAGVPLNAAPTASEMEDAVDTDAIEASPAPGASVEDDDEEIDASGASPDYEAARMSFEALEPDELDLNAADRFKAALDHEPDLEGAIIEGPSLALPSPSSGMEEVNVAEDEAPEPEFKRADVEDAEELIDSLGEEPEQAAGASLADALAQSWRGVVDGLDSDAEVVEQAEKAPGMADAASTDGGETAVKREERWREASVEQAAQEAEPAPIARSVTSEAIERVAAAANAAASNVAAETPQSPILQRDSVEETASDPHQKSLREVEPKVTGGEGAEPASPRRAPRRLSFGLVNAAVKARRSEAAAPPPENAADAETEEGDRVRRRARIERSAVEDKPADASPDEASSPRAAPDAGASDEGAPEEAAPQKAPPRRGRLGLSPIADRLIGMRAAVSSWSDDSDRAADEARASAAPEDVDGKGADSEAETGQTQPKRGAESPLAARRRLFSGAAASSPVEPDASEDAAKEADVEASPVEAAAAKAAAEARSLSEPEVAEEEASVVDEPPTEAAEQPEAKVEAETPSSFVEEAEANTMAIEEQARMVEAMLFASEKPMSTAELGARMPVGCDPAVAVRRLEEMYAPRGVRVVRVAGKWAFRTAPEFAYLMATESVESRKLSKAAIETLAIVAYHQPVTRTEIEEIRQVSVSKGTLDLLMELEWIKLGRRRQSPGRPVTFITTERFLDHFGLESTKDLPGLDELRQAGLLDNRPKLGAPLLGEEGASEEEDDEDYGDEDDAQEERQEALM